MAKRKQWAKDKMNEYLKGRYYARKKWALNILGGKCTACGSTKDLQMDHVDPSTKEFDIAPALRSRTITDLLKELSKCQCLCPRCHLEKTKKESDHRGEKNNGAKLRLSDVAEIRERISNGEPLRRIATSYGVSHVAILYIKKRRTWV